MINVPSARLSFVPLIIAGALIFSACAAPPAAAPEKPVGVNASASATPVDTEAEAPDEPEEVRTQAKTCDWESPRYDPGVPATLPTEASGDLATAIIGSWQHTHFDEGSGFEAVDTADIRFVFPSASEVLYCQDVPGITDQSENQASVAIDGVSIALPAPAPGYRAIAWDDSTMLWENLFDGSTFLLQRR